ncbi:MAG: 16S rRNA (cytosine(1402)-N(4))-methyltransferase RsmH [Deltaproteobacteria bacterium]|nr:MAG: 16S rRNA (cytosine(1402)-N(4))-methyltransferase RsmH [Deltaproteobacteria bacterium]
MEQYHRTVLKDEVIDFLNPQTGMLYFDGTLGSGGHAQAILRASSPAGRLIGVDWDEEALKVARIRLKEFGRRVIFVRDNFKNVGRFLKSLNVSSLDGALLDLGVSSEQLEQADRGFSFLSEARLDMRMDRRKKRSAFHLVNRLNASELERLIRQYGEEKWAKKIVKAIILRRTGGHPITTTTELAGIVNAAIPRTYRPKRIHPATRCFQALRIAVNDELGNLETFLREIVRFLTPGAKILIISFHSLEDRIVKRAFKSWAEGCECPPHLPKCVCGREKMLKILTRSPIIPSPEEVRENLRSRSAKLRVAERRLS